MEKAARNESSATAVLSRATPEWPRLLLWATCAVIAFWGAYRFAYGGFLMLVYLFALTQLARASTWRRAWYSGLSVGLCIAAVKLAFFHRIFAGGAAGLWAVYAIWIALFVALARLSLVHLGPRWGWVSIPLLWLGLEYFRSELYYLRFSWLNAGYAFGPDTTVIPLRHLGMYGVGFLMAAVVALGGYWWSASKFKTLVLAAVAVAGIWVWGKGSTPAHSPDAGPTVHVVGVQMEFPSESEVLLSLNNVIHSYPDTELIVLSEYTFDGACPDAIREWCRNHRRFLMVGGKDPAPAGNFYNTAFVIGPSGDIVFRQTKSVPIQFFKDGLPAPEQSVWDSPWGKIGVCICYDLGYTRVTDRLVELGAQALIVPTMDVADWGEDQHELHSRVAPVRAAEYGVPIFRLASSGISQWVGRDGIVKASTPFPGDGQMLKATLSFRRAGALPLDRWMAPASAGATGLLILWFAAVKLRVLRRKSPSPSAAAEPRQPETAPVKGAAQVNLP